MSFLAKNVRCSCCWPNQRTLAGDCDLSRPVINGHLRWLQHQGYIDARPCYRADGGQTSNEYLILFREQLTWPDGAVPTYGARQGVSDGSDRGVSDGSDTGVLGTGHLEETEEDPREEPIEEREGGQIENHQSPTNPDEVDGLFGLDRYVAGLGERQVLNLEWAAQDYAKPDWQAVWMAYVHENGAAQATADLDRLFDLIDDAKKPTITKKYEAGQPDWSKMLQGKNSVPTFVSKVDAIRSARARFAASEPAEAAA